MGSGITGIAEAYVEKSKGWEKESQVWDQLIRDDRAEIA